MNPDMKIMITARTARNNVLVLLSITRRGLSSFSDGPETSFSAGPKMRGKKSKKFNHIVFCVNTECPN